MILPHQGSFLTHVTLTLLLSAFGTREHTFFFYDLVYCIEKSLK